MLDGRHDACYNEKKRKDSGMLYQKDIKELAPYDLIVCGGGFSGFAAAYAAAREGLRTLLIERGGCLGGGEEARL